MTLADAAKLARTHVRACVYTDFESTIHARHVASATYRFAVSTTDLSTLARPSMSLLTDGETDGFTYLQPYAQLDFNTTRSFLFLFQVSAT